MNETAFRIVEIMKQEGGAWTPISMTFQLGWPESEWARTANLMTGLRNLGVLSRESGDSPDTRYRFRRDFFPIPTMDDERLGYLCLAVRNFLRKITDGIENLRQRSWLIAPLEKEVSRFLRTYQYTEGQPDATVNEVSRVLVYDWWNMTGFGKELYP